MCARWVEVREGVSRGGSKRGGLEGWPDCCHNCASISTPTTTMCARWVEVREGGSKGGGSRGVEVREGVSRGGRTAATTVRLPRLRRLQCVRGGWK